MSAAAFSTVDVDRSSGRNWFQPWRGGWPKRLVTKPYTDMDPAREIAFMPRIVAPDRALKLKMKLMGFA